jgi:hypothetical protein
MGGNEWWSVGMSSNCDTASTYYNTYYAGNTVSRTDTTATGITGVGFAPKAPLFASAAIPAQTLVAAGPAHPESNLEWLDRRVEELRVTL